MRREEIDATQVPFPGRRPKVLVEDPALAGQGLASPWAGVDVTTCSGPADEHDVCPLVAEGACPHGDFDVVVSALGGPWAGPVRAAWEETPKIVPATEITATDPEERMDLHVSAALKHLAKAPALDDE
jgi:hypothetical protein